MSGWLERSRELADSVAAMRPGTLRVEPVGPMDLPCIVQGTGKILYAKIGLAIVIALGPVFIALMLFEATRPFGADWTRQVANFVVLQVLVVALVGLMLTT